MKKNNINNQYGNTAVGVIMGILVTLLIVLAIVVVYLVVKVNEPEVTTETVQKQVAVDTQANIAVEDKAAEPTTAAEKKQAYKVSQATQAPTTTAAPTQAAGSGNTTNNTMINNYYLDGHVYGPYSYGNFFVDYNYSSLDADSYFLLPYSDTQYITGDDIRCLVNMGSDSNGRTYIQQAINELYARHNSVFKNSDVQNYFREYYNRMGWNTGSPFGSYSQEYVESTFSSCEKANYKLLLQYR